MMPRERREWASSRLPQRLRDRIPAKPASSALARTRLQIDNKIREACGRPITTENALAQAWAERAERSEPRKVLCRALAGGMTATQLWRVCRGGPVKVTCAAYALAQELADPSWMPAFAAAGGRTLEDAWKQPTGKKAFKGVQ